MEFSTLLAYALPYRGRLGLVVLLSLLGSLAGLGVPWLAAQLLGGLIDTNLTNINSIVALLLIALVALTSLNIAGALVSSLVANRIQADFRNDIYAHVQKLPLSFFDQSRQGDLLALMTWEVSRLSSFISGTLTSVPAAFLTAVGAMSILLSLEPLTAAIIPLLVPSYFISLKLIGRRLRSLAKNVQEAEASIFASAEENLEILPAIKAFAQEELRLADYAQKVDQARGLNVREQRIYAVLGPAMSFVTALAAIAIVLLIGKSVAESAMTSTELFSFLFYAALLTRPVGSLADLYGQFQIARGTLERLQAVLKHQAEPGYTAQGCLENCRGSISFKNVSFAYPGRKATLNDINVDINSGEVIALTGNNGGGKSTIVNLLLGLYTPHRGNIAIDGVDITELNVQQMRCQIGYVPQRPLLFNGTINDNICFGLEAVDHGAIERAATLAQASEFIQQLPQGYNTEIGDHGVRLSGGQRQRIALARALLKDPPILILDEATSMYDLEGEAAFVDACKTALTGRTVILITHRPASLALADRIINVEMGTATEV